VGLGKGEGTGEGGPVPVGEGRMEVGAEVAVVDSLCAIGGDDILVVGAAVLAQQLFGGYGFGVIFGFGWAGVGGFVKGRTAEELR